MWYCNGVYSFGSSNLHEVEESIFSQEKVKETQFTTRDVFKLIFAEMVARQKAGIVPITIQRIIQCLS